MRKHDRGALTDSQLLERLHVGQLEACRPAVDDLGSVGQLLRRLELALRIDDLRPAATLGLSLAGHGTLHRLRDLHVLDLDDADLHAPRLRLLVDDLLEILVQPLALRQ
jgi:hypothetical protein